MFTFLISLNNMKRLILTTLDNNNEIWYRCFVPFILSLKKTDYCGDIGVIAYHLSEQKRKILLDHNIIIFEAENQFSNLLIDRHISTAKIAEKYHYQQIALYDADIWFPQPYLTLFDEINSENELYCSYDVIIPPFLNNNTPIELKDYAKQAFQHIHQQHNAIWQAGVILGSSAAWLKYRDYITNSLNNLNGFSMDYGIDATILNLYAYATDNLRHLPEKYNCLPLWGIRFTQQDQRNSFIFNNELVQGLHITRYHRDSREFNYLQLYKNNYLIHGTDFYCGAIALNKNHTSGEIFNYIEQPNKTTLKIDCLDYYSLDVAINESNKIYGYEDLIVDFYGSAKLQFHNPHSFPIQFSFLYQELFNAHIPLKVRITLNGQELDIKQNKLYDAPLQPNDSICFESEDIWQDSIGIRYVFRNLKLIK